MKAAVTLLALASSLTAALGEGEMPQRLYRVEVITMSRTAASDLITQPLDGPALHARVIEAVKSQQATLDKLILVKDRHGVRATVSQTDGYEYPTEVDPPQTVQTLAIVNPQPDAPATSAAAASKEHISPFNGGIGTLSTTTATAFELRELGDRFEVEPADGGTLTYSLTSTELLATEHQADLPLPVFGSRRLEGQTRPKLGQTAFLGTYSHARKSGVKGQRDGDNMSLAFITATEEVVPKPADQPVLFKHPTLRATLEVLSIDKAAAHTLVLDKADEQALYAHLAQHGTREATLVVRGGPHTLLSARNADELISPTEFDPPQLSQKLILADSQLISDLRAGHQHGLGNPAPMDGGNPNGGFGFITTLSPTAFDMFTLGDSLELEYYEGDAGLEVQLGVRLTHLSGTVPYTSIRHPVVETRSLTTTLRVIENRRTLLGTVSKPFATGFDGSNKENRVWFAFLRLSK